MARPSTRQINEFDLVNTLNVKSIFNLQQQGEHASCGYGNEAASGFSYLPQQFMDAGIFFYNFGWKDMDIPELGCLNIRLNHRHAQHRSSHG